MPGFFGYFYQYYYLVLILQAFCVIHSVRRGNQQKWIWIIVFLPLIGSIVYLFTEVVKKNDVEQLQSGVVKIIQPGRRIRELEKRLGFSDTFTNRVALADAYLDARMYEEAAGVYESALTGLFADNEHAASRLIQAYYHLGKFEEITRLAPRISKSMNFSSSEANLFYAFALEKTGKNELAEREYREMDHRFSNFEARYHYGCFLLRMERPQEAVAVFQEMINEGEHMSRKELGNGKTWINKAQDEYSRLMTARA